MTDVPLKLGEWEVKVCQIVCGHYDDPLGYSMTAEEIIEQVGAVEGSLLRLEGLQLMGYLDWDGRTYAPTDMARRQLPDRYPPPIGTAKPFEVERREYEAWKASGEQGPCPMCGSPSGQQHGRKYCFGMSPQ